MAIKLNEIKLEIMKEKLMAPRSKPLEWNSPLH